MAAPGLGSRQRLLAGVLAAAGCLAVAALLARQALLPRRRRKPLPSHGADADAEAAPAKAEVGVQVGRCGGAAEAAPAPSAAAEVAEEIVGGVVEAAMAEVADPPRSAAQAPPTPSAADGGEALPPAVGAWSAGGASGTVSAALEEAALPRQLPEVLEAKAPSFGDAAAPAIEARAEEARPSTAGGRRAATTLAAQESGIGAPASDAGSSDARPSTAGGQRRRQKPKEDGLFAKGFLNKPKKPSAKPAERAEGAGTAAASAGSAAPVATPKPAPQASDAPSSSDTRDIGEVALRAAHRAIAKDQADGVTAFHACRFREALGAFERMRDAARGAGLGREEGQAYRLIANALDKLDAPEGDIEDAYKRALAIAHKQDDMELSFNTLTGMGSHAAKTGDLELAEHFYLQSLTLARRVLTQQEEAVAEGNLGMCLGQSEARRSECFEHFRKAIMLQTGYGANLHTVATLHANLASALGADGKHREAEAEYKKALHMAQQAGDRRVEANVLMNLANIYDAELSMPEKARQCRQALSDLRAGISGQGLGADAAPGLADDVAAPGAGVCAVCLDALEGAEGRPVTVLPCCHAYHTSCWEGYLRTSEDSQARCPECRRSLSFHAA